MKQTLLFVAIISLSLGSEFSAMHDACERGISNACYELGSIFTGEDGLNVNVAQAKKYLTKACELDHDKACQKLEIFLDTHKTK